MEFKDNASIHMLLAWAYEQGETTGRLQARGFEREKEIKSKDALLEATKADIEEMEGIIEGLKEEVADLLTECEQLKAERAALKAELLEALAKEAE